MSNLFFKNVQVWLLFLPGVTKCEELIIIDLKLDKFLVKGV